ncbi:hypothetical protein V3C99_006626 [Haemonchus contortus]
MIPLILSIFTGWASGGIPPFIEDSCLLRPPQCNLICTVGYQRGSTGSCVCACATDPCQAKLCAVGEHCVTLNGVARCIQNIDSSRPECSRVNRGICTLQCQRDSDCAEKQICCSNGCGRECMSSLKTEPFRSEVEPVRPVDAKSFHNLITAVGELHPIFHGTKVIIPAINTTISPVAFHMDKSPVQQVNTTLSKKEKPGTCPPAGDEEPCSTYTKCTDDMQCPDVEKCCKNACGSVCVDPTKATNCIHLVVSVKKLPTQRLSNNYLPKCDENGKFAPIQCDQLQCWCVDVNYGTEITGSAVLVAMKRGDMCRDLRLCGVKCSNHCPHGLKMTVFGCPDPTCACRDLCEGIRCPNNADTCQLIEPDCAQPPCLPVPRCLLNPCPTGQPMTLQNGVTALCATSDQCSPNHWCHKVGYNGLGFCCVGMENAKDTTLGEDSCPAVTPLKSARCSSKCSTDRDCVNGKCCFDGCGLSCSPLEAPKMHRVIVPQRRNHHFQPGDVATHNKGVLSSLVADCPSSVERSLVEKFTNCTSSCASDNDCVGMKRCCRVGCSTQCLYPIRTTPCLQMALTAELYGLRKIYRCDREGRFERVQCSDDGCFCVDIDSGDEISGTRTTVSVPNCEGSHKCPDVVCRTSCPYEFERDANGCRSCRCKNPCAPVKCHQGSYCIMTAVNCFQSENCPPQPRCVLNLCPRGEPFISQVGVVETCNSNDQCPPGHWCHQVGFSSTGLCCALPARAVHAGRCPPTAPLLHNLTVCGFNCRSDGDCQATEKCCYDGCGLHCKAVTSDLTESGEATRPELIKPGQCPYYDERSCENPSGADQCTSDDECAGVQKCCSDGCSKKCLYPENGSACVQAKSALQMIGQSERIQCRPDGSFEEVQCDSEFCWCVNDLGVEVEGTRSSENIPPNCKTPRKCFVPLCTNKILCKYGLKKDSNGCDTCECSSPCDGVVCPDTSICVPMPVDCVSGPCPEVPRCVVNPCLIGSPRLDQSTAQPIKCNDNNDCVGSAGSWYCSQYRSDNGVCCPGREPRWSPGTCPPTIASSGDCSRRCLIDEQCPSSQKCCFNGCGLSCVAAVFSAPPPQVIHIGECLETKPLGAFCVQRGKDPECTTDGDCSALRKCCSDGCTRRCTAPDLTTHCVHARLAALAIYESDSSVFVPECDSNGDYLPIQTHYGLKWCVDKIGREVSGTKTIHQVNCKEPRPCPVRACHKHCSFGYRTDNAGCTVCDCIVPCELVQCQAGFICRMVQPRCYTKDCPPISRCLPNICPVGEPLISPGADHLAECDVQRSCPAGYFCTQNGYEGRSFCCPGHAPPPPPITCPPVPLTTNAVDSSACVVTCRRASDCPQKSVCCFNGCGTSCQFETASESLSATSPPVLVGVPSAKSPHSTVIKAAANIGEPLRPTVGTGSIVRSAVDNHPFNVPVNRRPAIRPVRPQMKNSETVVSVPTAVASIVSAGIPSMMNRLTQTGPISAVQKVGLCPSLLLNPGCREECLADADCASFSKCCKASCGTRCVEPTVTSSCFHRLSAFTQEWPLLPPPVQCEPDGTFREIQCDFRTRQCWCVDSSGVEVIGTRTNSNQDVPLCKRPKICSVSCGHSSCDYGIRVDANGCPHNGVCLCKNPCDDLACSLHKTCALVSVQCDRDPCPPVPKCITSPCDSNYVARDLYGNAFSCRNDSCPRGKCVIGVGETVGICCQTPQTTEMPAYIKARSNCVLYRNAIEDLRQRGVHAIHEPACNQKTGLFLRIQCESSGSCWCVDVETGRPVPGSRRSNSVGQNVCEAPRICPTQCSRSMCPYGPVLDQNFCPFPDCRCSSPCDSVTCKGNEVCILRTPSCSSNNCIPLPTCENSPCNVGDRPVIDPRTKRQFYCRESGEICPTGFYCTGFDAEGAGVCCPGREPLLTKAKTSSCPHGDPFASSSDGTPLACSSKINSCPSTHYCSTHPGEKVGICCVSKRYVCGLNPERGPCSVTVPRYFYSPFNQTCSSFDYGGCSGNLNNFATKEHCEAFCDGVGADLLTPYLDEASGAMETYELGFSLTGPQIPSSSRKRAQEGLAEFLSQRFSLSKSSIDDVIILDDNTARFTIKDPQASRIAKSISEAVTSGLELHLNGYFYRAEPHTWFAHQVAEHSPSSAAKTIFWILLSAALIFAGVVVIGLCATCAILFRSSRSKDCSSNSTERISSPSEIVSHSIFTGHPQRRPPLRQDLSHYPSNATTRSARSIPQVPAISIERSRSTTYY